MIHANFHDVDGAKHVYLSGILSSDTRFDLDEMVRAQKVGVQNWFFDLNGLELITSSALSFFLEMTLELKASGHIVAIRNANEQTRELITRSGLNRMVQLA